MADRSRCCDWRAYSSPAASGLSPTSLLLLLLLLLCGVLNTELLAASAAAAISHDLYVSFFFFTQPFIITFSEALFVSLLQTHTMKEEAFRFQSYRYRRRRLVVNKSLRPPFSSAFGQTAVAQPSNDPILVAKCWEPSCR